MKKIFCLFCIIAMLFTFVSCNQDTTQDEPQKEEQEIEETQEPEETIDPFVEYKQSYVEVVNELKALDGEIEACYVTVLAIWEEWGASDFFTVYYCIPYIGIDEKKVHESAGWLLGKAFCPEDFNSNDELTLDGKMKVLGICEHYNTTMANYEQRYENILTKLKDMRNTYGSQYASEIDRLQEWYAESEAFACAAFDPNGSFVSYSDDYEEFKDNLDKYQKKADIY